jgi:fatty acid desaturase
MTITKGSSPTGLLTPIRTTSSRSRTNSSATQYSEILNKVRDAGLLKKQPSFYLKRLAVITSISLILWVTLVIKVLILPFGLAVGLAFPLAILQGIMAAQYGFIAHEASHRQIFNNNKWNDNSGRILANLFAGLSYGFWMNKHNRHHAKPNQIGADPDIAIRVLSFTTESLESKKGPEKILSKNQGWLFPILLFFTSFDLLLDSLMSIVTKTKPVKYRFLEFGMMLIRQTVPFLIFFFLFQNFFIAAALWLVMMMSFGFFMGAAFAPNHKGMPMIAKDAKIDFFQRQVLTSRNVKSSWLTDNLMGGLNFQVEHHLFPNMARPNLKKAHQLVIQYCKQEGIPFVEMGIIESYGVIIKYLNKVGLSNNINPFNCPMVSEYRPRN